ncbi:hypothetical protein RND81_04G028900 [Saponaria officinalis]|uniref:Uncharacterized protein n=1 Tax=Saponaria officinalis TaxID=3572 RepID=A0AAW1LH52_SAPOF
MLMSLVLRDTLGIVLLRSNLCCYKSVAVTVVVVECGGNKWCWLRDGTEW